MTETLPTKNQIQTPDQILRRPRVEELTGAKTSTIYAWIQKGLFPKPVKLGPRSVGWRSSDITAWLDSRQPARGGAAL